MLATSQPIPLRSAAAVDPGPRPACSGSDQPSPDMPPGRPPSPACQRRANDAFVPQRHFAPVPSSSAPSLEGKKGRGTPAPAPVMGLTGGSRRPQPFSLLLNTRCVRPAIGGQSRIVLRLRKLGRKAAASSRPGTITSDPAKRPPTNHAFLNASDRLRGCRRKIRSQLTMANSCYLASASWSASYVQTWRHNWFKNSSSSQAVGAHHWSACQVGQRARAESETL
jgi:hypothetical protein